MSMDAGRALDALIAEKVMGLNQPNDFGLIDKHTWQRDEDDEYCRYVCRRCYTWSEAWVKESELEVGPCDVSPTHYSRSLSAAWQVVDWMKAHNYVFILEHALTRIDSNEGPWWCQCGGFDMSQRVSAYGQTAPLAICRAALAAVAPADLMPEGR